MPECGSQCWYCDLPVRYDTYKGCSHLCKYCFAQRRVDLNNIQKGEGIQALENFIKGNRTIQTNFIKWDIPLHIGGMSDPFQPCEKTHRYTYEALKLLAKTKYPFVISTKGKLVADDEYLVLLNQCNCVVQISMACNKYDKLELGAPTFEERLVMLEKVSKNCKRSIVRIQPYMHEVYQDVFDNMKRFAEAGAYGVILEGMKFVKKKQGLIKLAGDYVYPLDILKHDFERLKAEAHKHGLVFLSGENRLRDMGDSLTCCGCDGLDGFKVNKVNLSHILNGDIQEVPEEMKVIGSGTVFNCMGQDKKTYEKAKKMSYHEGLLDLLENKEDLVLKTMGKRK